MPSPSRPPSRRGQGGFLRDREISPDACRDGGSATAGCRSRSVPIGSRSIGVSLQPAIPRRVAPQQSPLPLRQSPTIVVNLDPARQSTALLSLTARMQFRPLPRVWLGRPRSSVPPPTGVSSLLCALGVFSILRRHPGNAGTDR